MCGLHSLSPSHRHLSISFDRFLCLPFASCSHFCDVHAIPNINVSILNEWVCLCSAFTNNSSYKSTHNTQFHSHQVKCVFHFFFIISQRFIIRGFVFVSYDYITCNSRIQYIRRAKEASANEKKVLRRKHFSSWFLLCCVCVCALIVLLIVISHISGIWLWTRPPISLISFHSICLKTD